MLTGIRFMNSKKYLIEPTCVAIVENIEFGIGCRRVIPEDEVVDVGVVDGHLSVYVDRRLVHSQTRVLRQCMPVGGTCTEKITR